MKFKKFIKESLSDMDKRCPDCNNLLNDMGTCPYCDEGEEAPKDLDEKLNSDNSYFVESYAGDWFVLKNNEGYYTENNKLKAFCNEADAKSFLESLSKTSVNEEMSAREKLKAAYPELNFDAPVTEEVVKEDISNRDKLKAAYPELNFDSSVKESVGPEDDEHDDFDDFQDNYSDYDDDYDMDDVEQDYAHASLYGGDLTYCRDCGTRLARTEWGSYCPECNPELADDE